MSTRFLTAQTSGRRFARRRGFTVIEVMVAMFILLVGGLAILNIFPPALQVIRGSESREIAISMSQSSLERYNSEPDTIPEAIHNDNGNGIFVDSSAAVAGTRNRNFSLPKDNTQTAFESSALSNINNFGFRRIVGEKHKVLTNAGALFVLTNYANNGNVRFYVEEKILGVKVGNDGDLDFTNARLQSNENTSLSDATIPTRLSSTPINWLNAELQYYVSYRWNDGSNNVNGVDDEKIAITNNNPRVFQGRIPAPARTIVAGEIPMRVRVPITPIAPIPTVGQNAVGYSPLPGTPGAVQDVLGGAVEAGDVVSVDYTVSDWRNLIIDTSLNTPSSKAGATASWRDVKLPVSTLNTSLNPPLYGLILEKTGIDTFEQPAIVQWGATPDPLVPNVSEASATFDVGTRVNPQARISYQTSRGWAQQVSVAAKTYYPYDDARLPALYNVATANAAGSEREPWREYSWSLTSNPNTLYFRASEAGKTVLVTFRYAGGLVSNQIVPIDREIQPASTAPAFAASVEAVVPQAGVAKAVLIDTAGNPLPATAILSVRGASILSRMAWIENKNYIQEVKEGYRPLN